jgi:hypothetical protein
LIFPNDVIDEDNIDDGTDPIANYMKPRVGGAECTEDATSDDYYCSDVDTLTFVFIKGQDEVGYCKRFYTPSKQMVKYSDKIP